MRLHDKGRRFPPSKKPVSYADALGSALRQEFGDRRFAVKTVGRWTGASDRTIKNWFAGSALPTGHHLIALVAHSDAALETVLAASRRVDLLEAFFALRRLPAHPITRPANERRVPGRVPDHGPDRDTDPGVADAEGRQRWFIVELLNAQYGDASSLQERFGVSSRTAKRDIAAMKASGVISFEGTRRKGRYVLNSSTP